MKRKISGYIMLDADLDDPRVIWSDKGGVYGEEEEVYVEDPENPEEGEWYYPITPAKYLYFGVRPTEETITISTAGMATFSSRFSLNFSEIEGMKAYVVSEFEPETKTLVMESVDEVPAQTGLLLKGTPGTYTVPVIDEAEYTCPSRGTSSCNQRRPSTMRNTRTSCSLATMAMLVSIVSIHLKVILLVKLIYKLRRVW